MRNKAKFRNAKNELNPLYYKGLQKKFGVSIDGKTKPNKAKICLLSGLQRKNKPKIETKYFTYINIFT
jgi:hypothetical protein